MLDRLPLQRRRDGARRGLRLRPRDEPAARAAAARAAWWPSTPRRRWSSRRARRCRRSRDRAVPETCIELELDEPVDAVFSNAVFHWIGDHAAPVRAAAAALGPAAGWSRSAAARATSTRFRRLADEVAAEPPYAEHMRDFTGPWNYAGPEETEARLRAAGFDGGALLAAALARRAGRAARVRPDRVPRQPPRGAARGAARPFAEEVVRRSRRAAGARVRPPQHRRTTGLAPCFLTKGVQRLNVCSKRAGTHNIISWPRWRPSRARQGPGRRPPRRPSTQGSKPTPPALSARRTSSTRPGGNTYIGQAAHCASTGAATDTNGCRRARCRSAPRSTSRGPRDPGPRLQLVADDAGRGRDEPRHLRQYNDLALVKLDPGRRRQGQSVGAGLRRAHRGGRASATGDDVYSYGNSSLRVGVTLLSPRRGSSSRPRATAGAALSTPSPRASREIRAFGQGPVRRDTRRSRRQDGRRPEAGAGVVRRNSAASPSHSPGPGLTTRTGGRNPQGPLASRPRRPRPPGGDPPLVRRTTEALLQDRGGSFLERRGLDEPDGCGNTGPLPQTPARDPPPGPRRLGHHPRLPRARLLDQRTTAGIPVPARQEGGGRPTSTGSPPATSGWKRRPVRTHYWSGAGLKDADQLLGPAGVAAGPVAIGSNARPPAPARRSSPPTCTSAGRSRPRRSTSTSNASRSGSSRTRGPARKRGRCSPSSRTTTLSPWGDRHRARPVRQHEDAQAGCEREARGQGRQGFRTTTAKPNGGVRRHCKP